MNVPSLAFVLTLGPQSRRWRPGAVQEPLRVPGCWTASAWPQTLRFAAICFVWVGCRTFSKALGGAARCLTSTCTVLRFGRQVVVRPQLCDFRLRIFLVSSGSVRGTHVCKPDVPTLVHSLRRAHPAGSPRLCRARLAFKVARCGGSPLIRCGAATPHNAALAAVNGCAQRSPGHARRRTPPLPHGYV